MDASGRPRMSCQLLSRLMSNHAASAQTYGTTRMASANRTHNVDRQYIKRTELNSKEFTATAGGGAVSITVTGKKEITGLTIDREVVDPDDVEMLQDLIMAAVNESMRQVDEASESEMGKLTGGFNIPGLA